MSPWYQPGDPPFGSKLWDREKEGHKMSARDNEDEKLRKWLRELKWKSVDKDNMEYEVRVTCWVKEALERFANEPS